MFVKWEHTVKFTLVCIVSILYLTLLFKLIYYKNINAIYSYVLVITI